MVFLNLLMVAAVGFTAAMSTRYFSPQELLDDFEKGQKLYALGDYAKAIGHYEDILAIQSNATIEVENVDVDVDEFLLPVRVAATYQLANSHNKLGLDKLQRSEFLREEKKQELAEERYTEALSDLNVSLRYFSQLAEDETVGKRTRVMAQFQMLETAYQLKRYDRVVMQGQAFLRDFPNSVYEASVYYNMGWSSFQLERYTEAIGYFEQVLFLSPRGLNSDRALLQIAECHQRLGDYPEAIASFDRLISRYDFSQMSEQQLIEMTSLKLKGLIKETARELVANAQLKKGDIFAEQGRVDEALEAYAVVPEKYEAETQLVQNAYIRSAELIRRERGTEAAISAYKNSIENVEDKQFQARAQLTLASLLFEDEKYEKAGEEYGIFLKAYIDVAERIEFTRDKALFRIAQCFQAQGQKDKGEGNPEEGKRNLRQAMDLYTQLIEEYGKSILLSDAFFGLGFSAQAIGDNERARNAYKEVVERFPEHPVASRAWVQLARLEFGEGDLESARDIYLAVLERYPEFDHSNSVYMELGIANTRLGDTKAAIEALESVGPSFEQWSQTQVELAQLYLSSGDVGSAEGVLKEALGHESAGGLSERMHYMKGKIHFDQADFLPAIQEFSQALAQSSDAEIQSSSLFSRGASYYELAKIQDASGDSLFARSSYQSSLEDMKKLLLQDVPVYMRDGAFRTLGAVMIRLDQEREAAEYYQELITGSSDPQEKATFRMLMMELYYDMGDFARAEMAARGLLDLEFQDDNNAGYFRKERAYSIIGNVLLQQGKYPEAAVIFAKGVRQYPNSGESANMAFSRAFAQFSAGEYQDAARNFRRYSKEFPRDRNRVHGQYYLAHSHQALTEFGKAANEFSELVKRYPKSEYEEEALFLVGENHYNRQDFSAAAEGYQKLLEKYPDGDHAAAATYALAWAYFEQEMMEEGVEAMEVLVRRYPQSENASRAQFTIGDFHYNARSYGKALEAYRHLIASYPESDEAGRAERLVDELNEIEASLEYAKVMKLFEAKKYEEALIGFEQIIQNYPGTYTELASHCNKGLSYEIMRKWKEAAESYEQVVKSGGDDPENADVVGFAKLHRDWIVENRL